MTTATKYFYLIVFIINIFLFAHRAHAGYIDANAFYYSDALTTTSNSTIGRTFADVGMGLDIDKKGYFQAGLIYTMMSTTDTTSSTTTWACTDLGVKLSWNFDKNKVWGMAVSYYITSTATYTPNGGTAEKWKGTGIKGEIGYAPPITENFRMGGRLNYYSGAYTEKIVNDTSYTKVSYTRVFIYPALYISYIFE